MTETMINKVKNAVDLNDLMKTKFLETIKEIPLGNDQGNFNNSIYGFAYGRQEYIQEELVNVSCDEVKSALQQAIYNQASIDKQIFVQEKLLPAQKKHSLFQGRPIHEVANPRCLAYAIDNEYISSNEFIMIPEDKSVMAKNDFMNTYGKESFPHVVDDLYAVILNPEDPADFLSRLNGNAKEFFRY